jgi:hypothetical protein
VHCSQVFRSSGPSDLLPSSPGRCPSGTAQGESGSTRSKEWGVGPGGRVSHRGCCPAEISPAGHIREDTLPGPVRSQGRVAQVPFQQVPFQQVPIQPGPLQSGPLQSGPLQSGPLQSGPLQSGPLQSGPLQQVKLAEPPRGTGEYPSSALLGAPVGHGRGRQSPDQARDMAAELAGWTSRVSSPAR